MGRKAVNYLIIANMRFVHLVSTVKGTQDLFRYIINFNLFVQISYLLQIVF